MGTEKIIIAAAVIIPITIGVLLFTGGQKAPVHQVVPDTYKTDKRTQAQWMADCKPMPFINRDTGVTAVYCTQIVNPEDRPAPDNWVMMTWQEYLR